MFRKCGYVCGVQVKKKNRIVSQFLGNQWLDLWGAGEKRVSNKRQKFTVSLCSVLIQISENRNGLRVRERTAGSDKNPAKPVRPGQTVVAEAQCLATNLTEKAFLHPSKDHSCLNSRRWPGVNSFANSK